MPDGMTASLHDDALRAASKGATKVRARNSHAPVGAQIPIEHLGRALRTAILQDHLTEALALKLGDEKPGAPMDEKRWRVRDVKHLRKSSTAYVDALEALILASRAETLADAAVQMMVGASRLVSVAVEGEADVPVERDRLEAVMMNCTRIMAQAASMPLGEVGGRFYAPQWCNPWPNIDLSEIEKTETRSFLCIDGSGT